MSNNTFLHEEIYRGDSFEKFRRSRLLVCGVGALGSNLVDNLTRQGFSDITILDKDRIEKHNINTQVWTQQDIGLTKVQAMANKVYDSVEVDVKTIGKELTVKNAKKFLKGYDLVIDCFDNSASRQILKDNCDNCLHAGLFQDYGEVIWNASYKVPADAEGDICDYPLARNIAILTVLVLTEEIVNSIMSYRPKKNWSITLKDLQIRELGV